MQAAAAGAPKVLAMSGALQIMKCFHINYVVIVETTYLCSAVLFSSLSLAWESYIPGWVQPVCPSQTQLPGPTADPSAFLPVMISHTGCGFTNWVEF